MSPIGVFYLQSQSKLSGLYGTVEWAVDGRSRESGGTRDFGIADNDRGAVRERGILHCLRCSDVSAGRRTRGIEASSNE